MDSNQTVALPQFPQRIGRYEILGELGRGAMGIVYKGFDPNIGRTIAIKTVQLGGGTDAEDLLKRFKREAQAAGLLSHPHIVTIHDAGEDQGVFYIAMEYVEGDTLAGLIYKHGPLPLEQITAIIEEVGSALDHAHRKNIVHRDVKPANIMITPAGAKVMDFGVAKVPSSTATSTGTVIGTPSYMSPEGVKGMPVDGRADIFSLGVMLYEMLTNKRPFAGDSIPTVIYKIIGFHPDPPSVANPNLHPGLNVVLTKVLAKDPESRYQTCADLLKDLKSYQSLQGPPEAMAMPFTGTPSIVRTLAPPMVDGTVALDNKTMVISAPTPVPAAPPAGPVPGSGSNTIFLKIAAGTVLLAVLAGGGLLWKRRQQQPNTPAPVAAPSAAVASPASTPVPVPDPAPAAVPETPAAALTAVTDRDVMVKANVAGAAIKVDGGQTEWTTPRRIKLPFGAHRIEVSKSGYKTAVLSPKVTEQGPKELSFTLAALTRDIEIVTTPPGARINIDGSDLDAPTPGHYTMPYGEHTIQVRKDGFHAESRTVDVSAATEGLTVALVKEGRGNVLGKIFGRGAGRREGRVRVLTTPAGAEIQVDGAPTDYKSPVNFALTAGPHKITVTHKGREPVTRDVDVKGGEMVDLEIDMQGAIKRRQP